VASDSQNGWNEYSRLVLKELETLAVSIDGLRSEMQDIKQEIALQKVKEEKLDELRAWKDRVDEVASPSQIKTLVDEVESLKAFKTKAITAFVVVQTVMGIAMWASKFITGS
jgi:Tfp pilus assembly protein PilO